jgi:hypothetical protein
VNGNSASGSLLVRRWQLACPVKNAAERYETRAVKLKFLDGGSPCTGETDHYGKALRPGEVFGPAVAPRVKQRDGLTGEWIDRRGVGVLAVVAFLAAQREVVLRVGAAG